MVALLYCMMRCAHTCCAWQRDTASVHTDQIAQSLTEDARDAVFEARFDFDSGERDSFFFLPWFLHILFLDRITNSLLEFFTFKHIQVYSAASSGQFT